MCYLIRLKLRDYYNLLPPVKFLMTILPIIQLGHGNYILTKLLPVIHRLKAIFIRILMVLSRLRNLNWFRSYSFLNIDMAKFFTNINHDDVMIAQYITFSMTMCVVMIAVNWLNPFKNEFFDRKRHHLLDSLPKFLKNYGGSPLFCRNLCDLDSGPSLSF